MVSSWGHLLVSLFGFLVLVAPGVLAQDLLVRLDYGTFQGAYSQRYNISYWQKIPFAAPPVGENRFRAPQPPVPIPAGRVYNSTQAFDMCPQRTVRSLAPLLCCADVPS